MLHLLPNDKLNEEKKRKEMYTGITVYLNDSTFFNLYYHTIIMETYALIITI